MPSTPYDLVQDDQDLRVPLHADQAFLNGITFQAKVCRIKVFLNYISCKLKSKMFLMLLASTGEISPLIENLVQIEGMVHIIYLMAKNRNHFQKSSQHTR
ncbi:uncharacterized protein ACRADG_002872 isoform 1-T1 [Cochliomyia hominivorax]